MATIIGPLIFSNIYASTVTFAPKTIFYVAIVLFSINLGFSMLVREHVDGGLYDDGADELGEDEDMELQFEAGGEGAIRI